MASKDPRKSGFIAHFEQLEDRRVMSADPLIEHNNVEEPPALEQTVQTGELGDPDFWIDAEDATNFDDYFQEVEQALVQAHTLTGWYNVQANYGFTGRGQTVAVIDSGIAYDHFALGGGVGANYRVVGGWDFTEENDWNMYDDGTSGGHGTHVSGIIGGSGLYDMPGLTDTRWVTVDTPWGAPSDEVFLGTLGGARLAFLPRHLHRSTRAAELAVQLTQLREQRRRPRQKCRLLF